MLRLITVHDLQGSKSLVRILCFLARFLGADAVVLLGNTVSPTIIEWLSSSCRVRVMGILGSYDNASVAVALNRIGGLAECRLIKHGELRLLGIGLSSCPDAYIEKVDIVVSSLPGLEYTCCRACSDILDSAIKRLKPRLVVTGTCKKPCFNPEKSVFSPGSLRLGFLGLVELSESGEIKTQALNVESTIAKLV
ncbi:MAG: phosphoesterase [Desulfurococcaceae archaeon]